MPNDECGACLELRKERDALMQTILGMLEILGPLWTSEQIAELQQRIGNG